MAVAGEDARDTRGGARVRVRAKMGEHAPGIWRFGAVELDERLAALRVAGRDVPLDRSSYDILLALLRHSGEVVTKDELLDAGWPGRVVSENSLAKAVSRLRQALGDDAAALRVVHGYGYRLAAAVRCDAPDDAPAETAPAAPAGLQPDDPLPQRPGWRLERRIGQGATGVIWLAVGDDGERRAAKFANGEEGVRGLKREIALSRYLRSVRADFAAVAPVLGWNLAQAPYFLELPWYAHGSLRDWAAAQGGLSQVQRAERLRLAIDLCEAVAALHEVGIIHRDLKPENIFPVPDAGAGWRVVLGDLGASDAAASPQLAALGITMSVLDSGAMDDSPRYPGSLLYIAPEVVARESPTQRSDVFALGVLAFQLAVGDLRRSLAPGWEADVDDPLLCEDIRLAADANPARRNIDARGLADRLRTLEARRVARDAEARRAERELAREQEEARDRTRRRFLFAVSATLALGLAGTSVMYAAAEKARRNAEREALHRKAVLDFVNGDILGQADPYRNARATAALPLMEAVERAAETVDAKVPNPASAAAIHAMVASVYFAQDRHADAIAEFGHARRLYLRSPAAHAGELVGVETGLCDVHRIAGNLATAQEACLSAHRRAGDAGTGLATATLKLGQLRGEQGREQEALALLEPLLATDAFASEPRLRGELYWALGLAERARGRYAAARRHFEALLALHRGDGASGTWTAWAYNSLGSVLVRTGDFDAAEKTLLEARRLFRASQGAGQVEAQMPDIWRGEIRLHRAEWNEAAAIQQGLLDAWRPTLSPGHALWLKAEANLAWAEAEAGRHDAARGRLAAALRNREVVFDRPGEAVAVRTMRWVRAALALGRDAPVAELFAILDPALAREFPDPHPVRAEADCLHARWALQRGMPAEARARAAACGRMLDGFVDDAHPLAVEARDLLAAADRSTSAPGVQPVRAGR